MLVLTLVRAAVQFALTIGTVILGLYVASKAIDEKCAPGLTPNPTFAPRF